MDGELVIREVNLKQSNVDQSQGLGAFWDVAPPKETKQTKESDFLVTSGDGNLAFDWLMTMEKASFCVCTLSSTFSSPADHDARSQSWMLTRQKKVMAAGTSWYRQ